MSASENVTQTRLRDLYRYVGDDLMTQLPSLKSGARSWISTLQQHPSLQSVQTKEDLANWINTHPNTGVQMDDFSNYEKLLTYQSAFPNGLPSEDLQRRLQTEIRSDASQSPEYPLHSQRGHRTLDQFAKLFDPKGIDQDRNFRRILNNVIENHNRINPDNPFTEKLIVWRNRQRILNPNLPPEILTQARAIYGDAVGTKQLKYLDERESKRIYSRQKNDPAVRQMEKLISHELQERIKQIESSQGTISQAEIQTLEKQIRETHTAQFVRDYPEKAKVYSRGNKNLKEALKEDLELQKQLRNVEKEITKQQNKVYRLNPNNDPAVKSLKAGKLTPEEFVKKYPKKAKAYRRRITEIGAARKSILAKEKASQKALKQQQKELRKMRNHTDPATDLELQSIKAKYPNRQNDPRQKSAFEREMTDFVRNNKRTKSAFYQQDTDVKGAYERISRAQNYLERPGRFKQFLSRVSSQADNASQNQQSTNAPQKNQARPQLSKFTTRMRGWASSQYEKPKKQVQDMAKQYLSREFRRISAQYAKQAARYASSFARSSLGPGIQNTSRAISRLGSFPRAGLGAGRIGASGIPIRPPVPPAAGLVANPWFWVVLIIIILIILILLWFLHDDLNSGDVNVSVEKIGPSAVPNPPEDGSDIEYTIKVTWSGGPSSITVTDYIPENTEFVSATGDYTLNGATGSAQTVVWNIKGSGGGGAVSGDVASLLPNPVPPDPSNASGVRQNVISHFQANPELIQHYKDASAKSGLPWQVYAGLHWREADATPGYSLTSGRQFGTYEPDVTVCNGPPGVVDGLAEPGCVFTDEVDDILYVTDHLIGKIGKMPSTHEELSEALARYNGYPGRSNCHHDSPLYPHCPPDFPGEDNSYVFTFFDEKHAVMDEIYCADGTLCGEPLEATRPGAMAVIKWVAESIQ